MHAFNGLHFDRAGDGSVVVTVKASDAVNAQTLRDVTIDAERWAQVIEEMTPPEVKESRLSEEELRPEQAEDSDLPVDGAMAEAVDDDVDFGEDEDEDDDDGGLDVTPPSAPKAKKKKAKR